MKLENNWRQKSIAALEKRDFGNPSEAPTPMVKRCLELCRVPLEGFTVEDLRLMIGQEFALHYLLEVALGHLSQNLFAEGDLYPGDLLSMVFKVNKGFWQKNPALWNRVNDLIKGREADLKEHNIKTAMFQSALH